MIKFRVIKNTESKETFEKEVNEFLKDIKPENLIKISTNFWRPFTLIAFITYRD